MGEYISLLASVRAGALVDVPLVACRRYETCAGSVAPGELRVTLDIRATVGPGERRHAAPLVGACLSPRGGSAQRGSPPLASASQPRAA